MGVSRDVLVPSRLPGKGAESRLRRTWLVDRRPPLRCWGFPYEMDSSRLLLPCSRFVPGLARSMALVVSLGSLHSRRICNFDLCGLGGLGRVRSGLVRAG